MTSPYLLGRSQSKLTSVTASSPSGTLQLYAAEVLTRDLIDVRFVDCTFADISFKEREISGIFEKCAFLGCYFRKTKLKNCSFVGCVFVDCEFPKTEVSVCDFRYASFKGCFIAPEEIEYSRPSEANLSQALATNLAVEAESAGASREASVFREWAMRDREKDLRSAFLARSAWYKTHYDTFGRISCGVRYVVSRINGLLWGYGERPLRLMLSLAVTGVVFAVFYWVLGQDFRDAPVGFTDALFFSLDKMVPVGGLTALEPETFGLRLLAFTEGLIGLVFAGLFVTLVVQRVARR